MIVIFRADTFARLIDCPQDPAEAIKRLKKVQKRTGIPHFIKYMEVEEMLRGS